MKKTGTLFKVLLVIAVPTVVIILAAIVWAIIKGERTLKGIFLAPWTEAVKLAQGVKALAGKAVTAVTGSTPVQGAESLLQLPALSATETDLHNATVISELSAYAPGGRIYNDVANSQGTAAADANYAKAQADFAAEGQQAQADSRWWNWITG